MRGKPIISLTGAAHGRSIPAYAGKTGLSGVEGRVSPEHPRVCGENILLHSAKLARPGASPRMRGKRFNSALPCPKRRSIPAYAGKTASSFHGHAGASEHPRVCGENKYKWMKS